MPRVLGGKLDGCWQPTMERTVSFFRRRWQEHKLAALADGDRKHAHGLIQIFAHAMAIHPRKQQRSLDCAWCSMYVIQVSCCGRHETCMKSTHGR